MTDAPAYVREVDGRPVPLAGTWELDPDATTARFTARHMMLSRVRGGFEALSGSVVVGADPRDSTVSVTMQAASLDTGSAERDAYLKSESVLDVGRFPTLEYSAGSVEPQGTSWLLAGELTVRDMSRPVSLRLEFRGVTLDPSGTARARFDGRGRLVRTEWGLNWNVAIEGGGVFVGKTVDLEISAEAAYVE